jgi:hypothetical protein
MRQHLRFVIAALVLSAGALGSVAVLTPQASAARPGGQFCGGIQGILCPEGLVCVDDPRDDCNPKTGGADCSGICRRGH